MATIEKSILITAPVEEVFTYLEEPTHLPEVWPSLVEVSDVVDLPQGGDRYHYVYKMAGTRFEGDSETIEFVPYKHFVRESTGEIPSTFDWTFMPQNGSTKVVLKAKYEVPKTLLGKLSEPFILKLNEREADTFFANLKDRIEA